MPGPLGPAVILAGPGAVAAAKHLAFRAATSPGVTSATLTALVFYWTSQKLPDWVKKDICFQNLLQNRNDISTEELEGLYSVVEKLQNVASNIQELDTDIPQLHAALLAFIQLSGQFKIQQVGDYCSLPDCADGKTANCDHIHDKQSLNFSSSTSTYTSQMTTTITRDSLYETAGNTVDLSSLRSNEIQNALQLATFAYYEDSEVRSFRYRTQCNSMLFVSCY